ncbi:hypothetical protein DEU56DRAFT_978075 [Suillus clintonianus]|uniref:uncharacterized protein n=1 Tax=Suillus clintonianus TaxID=1904413 RepID=UPI001B8799E2|nr:uncharacterized protein DEU56DRAFT_978075 [Suillus clintonianus]KAG2148798.1 hypothetical protein DEU56DRAFT_978075 [Suillus clintonianus]
MPGSAAAEIQSIRLEVIGGQNLQVPSKRMPAGIHISINVDSSRRWKSAIRVLSSDTSVACGYTVTLSSHESPALSTEIRASFELDRMLGNDEPFELSFPPVRGVNPSLTLKATVAHVSDNQDGALLDSLVDCESARETDAGHVQFSRYMRHDRVSHLNGAVERFQLVLDRCPVDHPDHAAALTNLARARLQGYIQNDLQDIDTTTSLFREALALRPQGYPNHTLSLHNLTFALNWRYSKEPTAVYIHEPLQLCCKLLPLCPEGTYLRSIGVDTVLELCPLGQKYRPSALDKLSWALGTRFRQRGSIDDIDESIQLRREAVSLCPKGHSDRCIYLNNLAFSLESRFDHQGKSHDLEEVISMHEEALCLCSVGHELRGYSLGNLGGVLRTCFSKLGDVGDINRAVSLYRDALMLHPPGHPRRDTMLNNHANTLNIRYVELRVIEDLNEAIELYRESLLLKRLDDLEWHRILINFSSALCFRFTRTRQNEDVEEAIFDSAKSQNYRLASRHPAQGFPQRILQAHDWIVKAEQHGDGSALEAYSTFFELLDAHLGTRSSTTSRREAAAIFHYARSLHGDAASCAIRSDDLRRAVELVEQGLEDLESGHPHLAHKFSELSKRVSNAAQGSAAITDRAAVDQAATEYRRLTAQWDAAVAEIRNLQAFSWFLLPPSYEDLQVAARNGPVMVLVASQYSCSAIVVPTSGELHHIPLSSVTLTDLENLKGRFARAIYQASRMSITESRTDLIVLLRMVWGEIMLPIVNVLEHVLRLKRRSRIWLCPTAAFTSIPLHAAHPFQMKADRSGKEPCLEDIYICSYTPTLSALIRSMQMMKNHVPSSFVAIGQGQPRAGKGKVLLAVDSELELVHKLVPATASRSTLSGDAATRANALEALEQNSWVHLACHGKQDHNQPYDSHFVMKDAPLTLLDIIDKDIPHAEFAFLSATSGPLMKSSISQLDFSFQAFYENMVKHVEDGEFMDCTKAAWALNRATHAVKTKVPLEQRMVFIDIGV